MSGLSKKQKRQSAALLWAVAMVLLLLPGCITDTEGGSILKDGQQVPDFTVTLSDGSEWNSRRSGGKESVIVFFNTDCPDRRRELPQIEEAWRREGSSTRYICISREEREQEVAAYWQEHDLTLPYSAQTDRRIYNLFARSGIPRTYRISPEGRIINQTP